MDAKELETNINQFKWRHRIDLGDGIITPGSDRTSERLRHLALPDSLEGKTVLDIGAWDGFYSFESERRGAERVVALDRWNAGVDKKGFELARRVLGSRVEDISMDVLGLSPQNPGTFDVVLFLGVLYHLRHPMLALERILSVTRELLIVESHVDLTWKRGPVVTFYPDRELNNDPTNWWGPNPKALCAMIRAAGFCDVTVISIWPNLRERLMPALSAARRRPASFWTVLNWRRMVVHARP